MTRYRRWTLQQYLRAGNSSDVVLVKIDHPAGPVYLWNGLGALDADIGDGMVEFKGLGRLGNVSIAASDTETQITDVIFTLSGIDPEYLDMLDSTVKGSKAWVWKAFLGPDYRVRFTELISESELDQPTFSTEPNGQATMRVASNGGFYFLDVQSSAVWDTEQQRDYLSSLGIDPDTDTGFDLMTELKNLTLQWERPD